MIRLPAALRPERVVPTMTTGVVAGVLEVVLATSLAALVFSGPLSGRLPAGIGTALFAAIAMLVIVSLGSSLRGTVGSIQDSTAAILAVVAASLVAGGTVGDPFLTVVLAVGLSSVLAGVVFFVLGAFRLGNLVRFVPYPVIGGFLAGTGWLLLKGGAGVMAGRSLTLSGLPEFVRPDVTARWLPGLAFAVLLLVLMRRYGHFLIMPVSVVAGVALFYVVLAATGNGVADAEAGGWLLGPFPEGGLWRPFMVSAVTGGDWSAVVGQAPNIATVVVVGVLALLLNASGIELAVERDVDLNRELRTAGLGNVVAGLGGGMMGFHALSITALAHRAGARSRGVGVVAAAVCLLALAFGAGLLSLIPRLVVGGLLAFLGLAFLVEWVVDARGRMPAAEYVVVLLILGVIAAVGFLEGVAVGLVVAVVLFVVSYSRTDVVRHTLSGSSFRSNLDRPSEHRDLLRDRGDSIHVLQLHGFVFFGTANRLLERVRDRAHDSSMPPLGWVVLDFRRVTGVDSSAVMSFTKIAKLAQARGFRVVLAGLSAPLRQRLTEGGLPVDDERLRALPDLDRAMQWCEDQLLQALGETHAPGIDAVWKDLTDATGEVIDPARLMPYLETLEVAGGREVMWQGEPSEDVYFLEEGRLSAMLTPGDGPAVRLRTMGPGAVVGEVAFFLGTPRTASVVADVPSRLYRLTRDSLREMEHRDPEVAAAVHRLMARLLAERLAETLEAMTAMLD